MSKIRIGLVVDFRTYKDYYKRFYANHKSKILEFHILERDLEDGFAEKIREIKEFLKVNKIKEVSFHTPDRIMQAVLFEENTPLLENDKKKMYLMLDNLKKLSNDLKQEILLVFHQGIKLPASFFKGMSENEIDAFREEKLRQAEKSCALLLEYVKGSKLVPLLENSPPSSAADSSIHFFDVAFEDFKNRLGSRKGFVFDICHAAMAVESFRQDKIRFVGMESLRRKYKGVPDSLTSLEKYIQLAGKNTAWIHLSDANGILGENEGLVIGAQGSIIDFNKAFSEIKRHVANKICVLEIVNSHKDYSLNERSMEEINKFI